MFARSLTFLLLSASLLPLACRVESRAEPTRHWSLVAASNMTPELEDPETEPQPPPSPIYPNPGLMGCTTFASCECDQLALYCGGGYEQVGCKMTIPETACHLLGIFPPANAKPSAPALIVDPECILAPTPDGPPTFDDLGTIIAYCGIQHEARHGCHGSDVPIACSEETAYGLTETCLRGFYDRQCVDVEAAPMYCGSLVSLIDQQVGVVAIEACLCRGAEECSPCIDACTETGLDENTCKWFGYPACGRDDVPAR